MKNSIFHQEDSITYPEVHDGKIDDENDYRLSKNLLIPND